MRPPSRPLSAKQALVVLDEGDDVAVAGRDLEKGERLADLVCREEIPKSHKIARKDITAGSPVRKYAQIIGDAKVDISAGAHVHTHNLDFRQSRPDYRIGEEAREMSLVPEKERATFEGHVRPSGAIGTRNYIGVISTVNCSATACRRVASHFTPERLADFPNIDGVAAFIHGTGCGMDDNGEGLANLRRVMRGYAGHPNMAGVLLIGLGCESNQIDALAEHAGLVRGPLLKTMYIQSVGGLGITVEMGIKAVESMLEEANASTRQSCSASGLTLALQCGGSDGLSGITANPALGYASDLLVAQGGRVVLAETPEVYGAEHLLTSRAGSKQAAEDLIERIRWWEGYVERNGGSMDNNPTPGNKLGGLTTILEKSLGAIAKAGTTNLNSTLRYAEPALEPGFSMMDSPGFDPAAVTGQIASGSNLVAFTTGRGSAFGSKPAPTLKICTNSETYRRMPDDMDVNAGVIADGEKSVEEVGEEIFNRLLSLASGEPSHSEKQGLGDHEFVPWQIGATM